MIEAIKKRRSIRAFRAKEVKEEKLKEILKAAMFAPTAKHCRSWEFVVIRNEGTIKKLSQTKPSSEFIENAPLVLALAADETSATEKTRDRPLVTSWRQGQAWLRSKPLPV
ncbi:hypothetical protein FJZ40_01900 [Candidatus Shapirobacteria bacterium]|nr:hypothetical protein [Candidatus Shapirobacteria bacterium]